MSLTIDNPVLFFVALASIALFVPMLFERIRVPGLVGLILVAVILGPNGLMLMERNVLIEYLGQAGLLFIVFVAGLEIDLVRFVKYRNHSIVFGSISYLIPQILGTLMAVFVLGFSIPSAILLGSMFGSHTLLAYPIASRLGIVKTTPVTTSVGGTIITDTAALMVLAVIANSVTDDGGWLFWTKFALLLGLFMLLVFRVLPRLARWFYRTVPDEGARDFLFTILMVFFFAWLAEFAGLQPIIGAFLCGIGLNRLIPERSPLMSRVQFVGKTLLVPVFLISVGMLIDPMAVIADRTTMLVVFMMSTTVIITKWLGAFAAGKLLRYSLNECWILFGMSVNQAAATLAAVLVGYNIGLFSTSVLNGAVIMILISCLVGPWVTQRWGKKLAEELDHNPTDFKDRPQRILIPLANPQTVEPMMDLAMLLREPNSRHPIFPLVVVTDDSDVDTKVAEAEKLLSLAAMRGNSAEVPTYPVTRVDVNIADGIRRTLMEQQITTVLIGWNARATFGNKMFGNVLDQLLAQSRQSVVVARITRSLNTIGRVILAVPRSADHEPSFVESIHIVKTLCQQLSTPLEIIGPTVDIAHLQKIARATPPEVKFNFQKIPSLRELPQTLKKTLHPDDLVILLSARSHHLSWNSALETIPRQIATENPDQPFLILYAAEEYGSLMQPRDK